MVSGELHAPTFSPQERTVLPRGSLLVLEKKKIQSLYKTINCETAGRSIHAVSPIIEDTATEIFYTGCSVKFPCQSLTIYWKVLHTLFENE